MLIPIVYIAGVRSAYLLQRSNYSVSHGHGLIQCILTQHEFVLTKEVAGVDHSGGGIWNHVDLVACIKLGGVRRVAHARSGDGV